MKKKKRYHTVDEIFTDLKKGIEIFSDKYYVQLYLRDAKYKEDMEHFSHQNGRVIYWGSLTSSVIGAPIKDEEIPTYYS